MNYKNIETIREKTAQKGGLIHCITNPISINQCANTALAVGCRPMMAEHPQEVSEITQTASALLINLGNITDVRMRSMIISAQTAQQNNIPFVFDAVGVACSGLRRRFANELLSASIPDIIKGNYSEISALYDENYKSDGVDADSDLDIKDIAYTAAKLAKKYDTIILASGKTDIVTDGEKIIYIKNGTQHLSQVTGTGCMLGVLSACYISVSDAFEGAVTACAVMGISGELARTDKGSGSFAVQLMDKINTVGSEDIKKLLKIEVSEFEQI